MFNAPRTLIIGTATAVAIAACGGDGGDADSTPADDPPSTTAAEPEPTDPAATTVPSESTEPAATPTTAADTSEDDAAGSITSFDAVQPATVQIIATGSFRDPEVGVQLGAGSGSGFFVSEDGIAVTNNHVVTGAATLEVFIGGDLSQSYNATVLGVSECNDLAVIDVAENEPVPYLEFFDGDITAGTEVYAAGYPLGDPEFTLTRGIVSKANADGDITGLSSIDRTIEHDANIQRGNSGGALVGTDGQVIGVNYAGGSPNNSSTAQFYAIAADLAEPVVELLRNGDFESLGINGQAVADADSGLTGIWVAGVAPGSPASDLGILAGDVITQLNGLPMGLDGTMRDYCDVLRTSGDRPIAVQVLRFDTGEVLRGELRGDEPLELAFSLTQEVEESVDAGETAAAPPPPAADAGAYQFESIVDDSGRLGISVPTVWTDRSGAPLTLEGGTQVPYLQAAPDLAAFQGTWASPGLFFTTIDGLTDPEQALAFFEPSSSDCVIGESAEYADPKFTGRFVIHSQCGGGDSLLVLVAALPPDGSSMAVLGIQAVTQADVAALDTFLATFDTA